MAHKSKPICLVPVHWTLREVYAHRCNDGSHIHISYAERRQLVFAGLVDYVVYPRVMRLKRVIPLRGLSAKTGEYLAQQLYEGRAWARAMIAQMFR